MTETEVQRKTTEIARAHGCDRGTFTVCWGKVEQGLPCRCEDEARGARRQSTPPHRDGGTDMRDEPKVTYPPEMLPSPDEDDEAEVVVIDPDTRKATIVWPPTPQEGMKP